MGKLIVPLLVVGLAIGIYWIGKGLHHAGNEAGNALTTPIGRAGLMVGETNLVSADRAVAAYYADNLSYAGLTTSALQSEEPGTTVVVVRADAGSYCLQETVEYTTSHLTGPNGLPAAGPC